MASINERAAEQLRALAELFCFEIIREQFFGFEPSMFVRTCNGQEVWIALLEGWQEQHCFVATQRIPGVPMGCFGHGPWHWQINI